MDAGMVTTLEKTGHQWERYNAVAGCVDNSIERHRLQLTIYR